MLKPGVKLTNLQPQMVLAYVVIQQYTYSHFQLVSVITSANDSQHQEGSLHGSGCALDIRSQQIPRARFTEWIEKIQTLLGGDFDIVLEDRDGVNEHLHVEYDPR